MQKAIIYEQPLSERIRSFLRLEHLFSRAEFFLHGAAVWNSQITLNTLLDIQNLVGRSDLKTEVLKELERHTAALARLEQSPEIDRDRLMEILDRLDTLIDRLHALSQPLGSELKNNEFLNSVRQRVAIPGGTCDFDLPNYHHWLSLPSEQRARDLQSWLAPFNVLEHAVTIILQLLRDSAIAERERAEGGFYQRALDSNNPCQLVRIMLPADTSLFPEVSGGKHRITVRFLQQPEFEQRPVPVETDVEFGLACCMI